MRNDNRLWLFVNWPLAFWRDFACPLHDECSLSLLMNKFQGSWIPFQDGLWRGHLYFSLDINEIVLVLGWRTIQSNSHLFLYSLIPSSLFPHTLMLTAHLLEWCLHFDENIWCPRLGILCMDLYSYFNILFNSKKQKSMYERFAFP